VNLFEENGWAKLVRIIHGGLARRDIFEPMLHGLTLFELEDIDYELTRRMRRHKPINPLDPLPQCEPLELSDGLLAIVDRIQEKIEAKYQTKINQISDEDEHEILKVLLDLSLEEIESAPDYDPERGKKLLEELRNTVPYHKSVRYGKIEIVNGEFVRLD
jgi:hypothetical protein